MVPLGSLCFHNEVARYAQVHSPMQDDTSTNGAHVYRLLRLHDVSSQLKFCCKRLCLLTRSDLSPLLLAVTSAAVVTRVSMIMSPFCKMKQSASLLADTEHARMCKSLQA